MVTQLSYYCLLLALLIYGFSTTKQVEKDITPKISTERRLANYSITDHTARSISIMVFKNGTYEIDGIKTTKKTFVSVINQLHQDISPGIRNQIMNIHIDSEKNISNEEVWFIYNSVIDYGFHRIVTNNQEIIREKGNKPFATASPNTLEESDGNTKKTNVTIPILELTQSPLRLTLNGKATSLENLKEDFFKATNGKKSDLRINAIGAVDFILIKNIMKETEGTLEKIRLSDGAYIEDNTDYSEKRDQKEATPEQVAEYNKLAKYYNAQIKNNSLSMVKLKDITRIKELYELMSDPQKKNAEPFPNFPTPPPPPKVVKGVLTDVPPPPAPKVVKGELSNIPPPPPPVPANATKEQKLKYEKIHESYQKKYRIKNGQVIEKLPPPPPPKNSSVEEKKRYEVERVRYEKAKRLRMVDREKMIERESQMLKRVKERDHVIQVRELKRKEMEHARKEIELKREEREHAMKERKLGLEEMKNRPRPQSPLDHVINQAKKGANFYYEGKQITSDKAIKLLKENNRINISSKDSNESNPTVHLSTEPIKINNREAPKPTADNIKSHIKVMNRHGATFYLGNDKITFEDALKYVKKNRDADVTSSTASNVVIIRKP